MNIYDYDDPYELVDFVKRLEDLNDTQLGAYEAMVTELGWDRAEALKTAENWEFDAIDWDSESLEECVGYYYATLTGITDGADEYFNYEAYGNDICTERYVCDNGQTIYVID